MVEGLRSLVDTPYMSGGEGEGVSVNISSFSLGVHG